MAKQDILIFTDCYIYGGSEKLMSFILKNDFLNNNFTFLYSYRKHNIYEIGLKNEGLLHRKNNYPLILLSNETLFHKINLTFTNVFLIRVIKIPFFLLELIKVYFIWNLLILIYLLIRLKPSIIHINNGGYPAAKSCNVMVIANYLSIRTKIIYQINNQAQPRKSFVDKIYDKFINKEVGCFINASQMAKSELINKRNFDPEKILLLNNFVPLPKVKMNRYEILKELNIPIDSFLIIQVAFLTERKGQRYLINALNDLFIKNLISPQKVYCAFIGNGEDENFLKSYINKLGLSKNVLLLGYKNNSEDYISACDLFILPSIKDEDMPLVLLSALGYAKPIIASDFAGISQVIETNFNGVLVKNNLETLSNNLSNEIYRLYNDEFLRNQLSINAKRTYLNYSPETYGLKLNNIYNKIYVD
jgi:glycosyltransferase involved in cell wall biosynthesis